MRAFVFALGFLTGTAGTYLFLTRVWWPDVRLAVARPAPAGIQTVPSPGGSPTPTPSPLLSDGLPEAGAPPSPSPLGADGTPDPLVSEPPAISRVTPPPENAQVELPVLKTDLERLRGRGLVVPVQGVGQKALRDSFAESRGTRHHEAIDILAPRGTPVFAVDDGHVEKLFTSKLGGLTIYQFDPQDEYCYYYAHLNSYASKIEAGKVVRKGDVIGYVGTSGNAPPATPHLHFTIFRLGAEKRWWEGTAINAYPLWAEAMR